jgi:hypothetical protein
MISLYLGSYVYSSQTFEPAAQHRRMAAVLAGWDDVADWRDGEGYGDIELDAAWRAWQASAETVRRVR